MSDLIGYKPFTDPSGARGFKTEAGDVYWHGFHSREGFYFDSDDEGNVTIFITETAHHAAPVLRAITLPENEWASVVASVCRRGETAESWQAARDFHNASEDSNQDTEQS